MSRFVALHCGEETSALLAKHQKAFRLLVLISIRARWKDCPITGLKAGQAFIGDFKEAGLRTEAEYKHAKEVLANCKLATFKGTNKGTVATLIDSTIFSLSAPANNEQDNEPTANQQRANREPATSQPRTSNEPTATKHICTQITLRERDGASAALAHIVADGQLLIQRIRSLRPRLWEGTALTAKEQPVYEANRKVFAGWTDDDWNTQREFLAARLPEGHPGWQPDSLIRYLENPTDVLTHARSWKSKQRTAPARQPIPPQLNDKDVVAPDKIREFFKEHEKSA